MKFKEEYLFCSPRLLSYVGEVHEIFECIKAIKWEPDFEIEYNGSNFKYQSGYNKAFENEFLKYEWDRQPLLHKNPKLIGDFQKNDIFVEIQFQ